MNIMTKLTLRQMRLNRRRTIVTIVGVIISVAMFTAVSTLGGSFQSFMQQLAVANNGDYHMMFAEIDSKDLETIRRDENVERFYTMKGEGMVQLPEQFGAKRFLWLKGVSLDGMESAGVHLTEGRLPKNNSELVLSESIRTRDNKYLKIGDKVTLDVGERRMLDSYGQPTVYVDGEVGYMNDEETFVVKEQRSYTIVGFATADPLEPSWAPCLTAVTGLDPADNDNMGVFIRVKNIDTSIYPWAAALQEELDADYMNPNTQLLLYSGADYDTTWNQMISILVGILFAIIFVGSVALIYNAFAISVNERTVNFGLLASVGATNRQKRQSIMTEAIVILLISVPVGIAGGILGMQGVFLLVNPTVESLMKGNYGVQHMSLNVTVSPLALLTAVILSVITVLISAWIPARRASRVSPMVAIRQQKDITLTPNSVKTSWLTRKLFGFEGELAAKNMKRNKKRFRIAISSFVISLVLFLSAGSFTHYLGNGLDVAIDANYDIEVSLYKVLQENVTDDVYNVPAEVGGSNIVMVEEDTWKQLVRDVRNTRGVTDAVALYSYGNICLVYDELLESAELKALRKELDETGDDTVPTLWIYAMDDESLKEYCKKTGADYKAMQDPENPSAILVNDMVWREDHTYTNFSAYDLKKGDMLNFSYLTHAHQENNQSRFGSFQLQAVTGETMMGMSNQAFRGKGIVVEVIVSEKVYREYLEHDEFSDRTGTIFLNSDDPFVTEDLLWELHELPQYRTETSLSVYNLAGQQQEMDEVLFLINTFSYVFIALISAIGIANIFNTLSTSIVLRKREFAMLKSVGMTPRSFYKMLFCESIFYGLKSLLYGLPLSGLMMGLIWLTLRRSFDLSFSVPWIQVGIGIVSIFLIVVMTMFYSAMKVRKESIITGLRNQNL